MPNTYHRRFMEPEERFDDFVDRSAECWEWKGVILNSGYGQFFLDGKGIRAHRFAYELHNGPIPDGMLVCHSCDNPRCVNPDHLFVGTNADNSADMVVKGRHRAMRGEKHPLAKLSSDDVRAIRELAKGGVKQNKIARRFGVGNMTVSRIVRRKRWRHVK